jgi:hypothetical protein
VPQFRKHYRFAQFFFEANPCHASLLSHVLLLRIEQAAHRRVRRNI